MYRQIKNQNDVKQLQEDIDCMKKWCERWLLSFHPKKWKYLRIGNCEAGNEEYSMSEKIKEIISEKDIRVVIDSKLDFSDHLTEKMNKANRLEGLIRRTFVSLDEEIFKYLFVLIVILHLEYANQVWAPYLIKDIEAVENVERRASKLIPTLKDLSYEE